MVVTVPRLSLGCCDCEVTFRHDLPQISAVAINPAARAIGADEICVSTTTQRFEMSGLPMVSNPIICAAVDGAANPKPARATFTDK
jgi:hypothetical protein